MRNQWTLLALGAVLFLSAGCGSATPSLVPSYTPATSFAPAIDTPNTTQPANLVPSDEGTATETPETQADTPTATAERSLAPPSPTTLTRPTPTVIAMTPTPTPPPVTYSTDGRYAFPVAGDLQLMTWTHYHWDGSNAVDIEAARQLSGNSQEFNTFIRLPIVAVTTGTIRIADLEFGGNALLLDGEDGYSYYYGHLSERWVGEGHAVRPGDWLGRIGNTGSDSQYIEPHLHFTVSTYSADDWRLEPDVNAAERLLIWFDLPWEDLDIPEYAIDRAGGWPLAVPAEITRPFSEPLPENPDQGSVDLVPLVEQTDPIPVYATLGGEVNVNRATVMGLRAQITNRPARTTVVYSFLLETTVADGDVVQHGDVVGYVKPGARLNYMLFVKDKATDPVPTLGDPP